MKQAQRPRTALLEEENLEVETYVELLRAVSDLSPPFQEVFRRHGVTERQYNALRILYVRGEPLSCQEIGSKLIDRVPDLTRLLDRLERADWIERERSVEDRRVVYTSLTDRGQDLVERVHPELLEVHRSSFQHFSHHDLSRLRALLRQARQAPD